MPFPFHPGRHQHLEGYCTERGWLGGDVLSIEYRNEVDPLDPYEAVPHHHVYRDTTIRATLRTEFGTAIFSRIRGCLHHEDGSMTSFVDRGERYNGVEWIQRARQRRSPHEEVIAGLREGFLRHMQEEVRQLPLLGVGSQTVLNAPSFTDAACAQFDIEQREIADVVHSFFQEAHARARVEDWMLQVRQLVRNCARILPPMTRSQYAPDLWLYDSGGSQLQGFKLEVQLLTQENPRDRCLSMMVEMRIREFVLPPPPSPVRMDFQWAEGGSSPDIIWHHVPSSIPNPLGFPTGHHAAPKKPEPEEEIADLGSFMDSLKAGLDGGSEIKKAKFDKEGGFKPSDN